MTVSNSSLCSEKYLSFAAIPFGIMGGRSEWMTALVATNATNAIATRQKFLSLAVTQRSDPRQLFSLEKFERCAAAGRDERHLVGEPGLFHRGDGIPAADNGGRVRTRQRFGDRDRPRGEGRNFEDADR